MSTKVIASIVGGFVLLVGLIIINPFVIIGAGERGVILTWGAVSDRVLEEGIHWRTPIAQKVKKLDVKVQKDEVNADAASKDLQSVSSTVALNYRIDPKNVHRLWQEVGKDYNSRLIAPAIQEAVKAVTAQYTAEELISKRGEVRDGIKAVLRERLTPKHLIIEDFSIVNFSFSDEFNHAIESKQTAVQTALKAENDLRRIEIEAKQQIEKAKADAESIRIQANALLQNPQLVELRAVEKWNGVLPSYVLGGSIPFINVK